RPEGGLQDTERPQSPLHDTMLAVRGVLPHGRDDLARTRHRVVVPALAGGDRDRQRRHRTIHQWIKTPRAMYWTHDRARTSFEVMTTPDQAHRRGSPGFRRINLALFAAGLATFMVLYCTQPLLPVFAADYHLTPA